ncbi:MAG: condensation domain-containing protein, partial [Psychrosphaera sp.]|nr:condensation domain-containing protein [Psychrosphaera sp.]
MPVAFNVTGSLDMALLTRVFTTIIERHEVLRTVYVEKQGQALQHITNIDDINFEIKVQDLSHLTGEALAAQVKISVAADITQVFDLASDLMLRVRYVNKTANTGVLIFNMHHIASDGWSLAVLTKEFFALYQAYSQSQPNPLPELAIQYGDYAHWQRDDLMSEVLESQLTHWAQQLEDLPVLHSLPLDFERPKVQRHEGAIVNGQLPQAAAKRLLMVAKAHKITSFMLLHGALSLLLSRHSNSFDIVIGTPVANRLDANLEPLIGFFVNTLVLRADTRPAAHNNNLADYFAHIRQVNLDAQSHQDVSFEQVVERINAPRSTAHSPLFQIMMATNVDFGLNEGDDVTSFSLPGVQIEAFESSLVTEKVGLSVDF